MGAGWKRAIAAAKATQKPQKYGATATTMDGIRFASKAEARRYGELKLLEQAGEIQGLELQPRFDLHAEAAPGCVAGVFLGQYVADFRYREGPTGLLRIVDVKGFDVPLQRWKRHHAEAQYGITVSLYPPRVLKGRRAKRHTARDAKRAVTTSVSG